MRNARFTAATMTVDGDDLRLRHADVVIVAAGDEGTALDWEVVAYALDPAPLEPGVHELHLHTLEGRDLAGPAVLVRSVRGSHVLRGAGPLHGVTAADLD